METADWQALNRQIVARAQQDPAYRQALLADPRAALEQAFGHELPPDLRVQAIEQEPNTIYLLLPAAQASEELSEAELDSVAGGLGGQNPTIFTVAGGSPSPTIFTVAGGISGSEKTGTE